MMSMGVQNKPLSEVILRYAYDQKTLNHYTVSTS
jgi:hypothetical protein